MNNLHSKLKEYRDIRDNRDDQIRARVREHVDEIAYLRDCKKTLESQLQIQIELVKIERDRADINMEAVQALALKQIEITTLHAVASKEGFKSALRFA